MAKKPANEALIEDTVDVAPEAAPVSPLAQALALVEARDARTDKITLRCTGVNDVATELRQLREARVR